MALHRTLTFAGVAFLMASFSHSALAASFDCAKARSRQEKLICSTPELSKADDAMAAKYVEARSAAAKLSAEEASQLKENQSAWILNGIQGCTPDVPCLSKSYQERIAFLDFYRQQTQKSMTVSGAYAGPTWNLEIREIGDSKAIFSMVGYTVRNQGTPQETANTGDITDEGVLQGNTVKFDKKVAVDEPCKLQISLSTTKAIVQQEGTCGFGMNVWATGVYFKTSNAVPDISIGHGIADR